MYAFELRSNMYRPQQALKKDFEDLAMLEKALQGHQECGKANETCHDTSEEPLARATLEKQIMVSRLKLSEKAILRMNCDKIIEKMGEYSPRARLRSAGSQTLVPLNLRT